MTETIDRVDGLPRLGPELPATGQIRRWIELDAFSEQAILDDGQVRGLVEVTFEHPLVVGVEDRPCWTERNPVDRPPALKADIEHALGEVRVKDSTHVPDDVRQLTHESWSSFMPTLPSYRSPIKWEDHCFRITNTMAALP